MSGPAKYGALIYANDIQSLAKFYAELFAMTTLRETAELISLIKDGFNIIIHTPPTLLPKPDFNCVKLFMTVDNLQDAKQKAIALGGQAFDGEWANPIFTVGNIADPDGNHLQLRQFGRQ